jgi:hypothetical protein
MTLENTLLAKLAEWHPPAGRRTLTVPDESAGWAVSVTADRSDVLGCLVWELAVRRTAAAPAAETLRSWADRIAARVVGLLETLKVHEIDPERNEGLLRSSSPAQRGEHLFYYEVVLHGTGAATVRRYQAGRHGNGRREQIAFALTHEALAKFAADLTAAK